VREQVDPQDLRREQRQCHTQQGRFGRVVLGADGTPQNAAAGDFAFREEEVRDCELRAVHAWWRSEDDAESGDEEAEARSLLDQASRTPRHATPASPWSERARTAPHVRCCCGRPWGLYLGLVTLALLHHAPCPVAVIPQP
jgi:hypothetical protein